MRTKNPEQGLELKIIVNPSKRCVAALSSICRFHFEMDNVLGTDFVRCDMNDGIMYWENIVYYVISFREGWYGFGKPQCGDLEHRITLCESNSIKTDNIDGYILNTYYYTCNSNLIGIAGSRQGDRHQIKRDTERQVWSSTDHQIKRDAERPVWSSDPRLSTRRDPALRIKLLL